MSGQQNNMGVGEYWLQADSSTAIQYMEGYHSKWSIWVTSPIRQAWVRNFISYYSPVITPSSWDSSQVFEGVQSELIKYFTPKSRSLMRQLVSLITKQRMTYQAMAMTSGADVINDVKLANSLIDQIIQNERLDIKGEELVENALIMGGGFTKTCWRTDRGEPYTLDKNSKIIYTGGVEISIISVFDMYYDIDIPHWDQMDWAECRTVKNRWDLIAQHPDLEDELKNLPSLYESRGPNYWFDRNKQNDDLISIYEMFAKPSPALPKGRLLVYGDENTVLYDGDNPYKCIPLEPMIPEKVMNTGFGYPKFTDIAASQEQYDNCLSAIATNNAQFAVQSVTIPRGSNINVQELNGMRFVSFTPQNVPGGGKPEPMQLTQSSSETYKFIDILSGIMSEISGVHPALSGQLSSGATSGVAIATLTANAMEFINSIGKTYHICMEKTMLHAINCYKNFSKLPQKMTVTGRNNQVYRKEYTGKDFKNISGVRVIVSNPLMQTVAGRLEIAEKLMQIPKDLWPDYVSILEGRPLEDTFKGELSQADLIFTENENLMDGKPVIALATDDHAIHIQKHAQLLNDPTVRFNNNKIDAILHHIEEHKKLSEETDPTLLAMVRTGKMPQQQEEKPIPEKDIPNIGKDMQETGEYGQALPAEDILDRA